MANTHKLYKIPTISSQNTEIKHNSAESMQHSQEKVTDNCTCLANYCFHSNFEIHSKGGLRVLPRVYLVYSRDRRFSKHYDTQEKEFVLVL